MTTFPRLGTSLMALLGIGGLAACAPMSKTAPSEEIVALIKTSPQPAGVVIEVDEATIPVDGWMVIHATRDGKPVVPDSIGHTRIPKGHEPQYPRPAHRGGEAGRHGDHHAACRHRYHRSL